ncbi:MAG: nitroreductase family protein, partial [Lachnospiraceae bacterium]|nr:nitroreductase family protein [Lachnospiraceae bacterium]
MLDLIKTRRSTRKYLDRPVPRELLEQIVEAGRYAPSGGNNQTGHFLVVTDPAVLARLAEMAQEAFAGMEVTENT